MVSGASVPRVVVKLITWDWTVTLSFSRDPESRQERKAMRLKPATDPGHCGKNNLFTYLSIIFFCLNHAKISPHLDMLGFWMGGGRGYSASSVKKGEWNSCSILQQLSKKKVPPPQTTLDMTLIFKEVRKRWNKASHSFVLNHIFLRFSSYFFLLRVSSFFSLDPSGANICPDHKKTQS